MGKGMSKGRWQDRAGHARQKRCRAQKEEKERTKGKESLWLLEAPVRKMILQMHTPARTSQCWSRQTPHGLGVCIWMHLVNGTGNSLSLGQPTPEQSNRTSHPGALLTQPKPRSDPQGVRMSSGKRPTGAAKGKQPNTEALCQPPPPPQTSSAPHPLPFHCLRQNFIPAPLVGGP